MQYLAVALDFHVMNPWSTNKQISPITTGHQVQKVMNFQPSPPLESITTKGAIFREIAADMKDRKKRHQPVHADQLTKPFKPITALKEQCVGHCESSTFTPT